MTLGFCVEICHRARGSGGECWWDEGHPSEGLDVSLQNGCRRFEINLMQCHILPVAPGHQSGVWVDPDILDPVGVAERGNKPSAAGVFENGDWSGSRPTARSADGLENMKWTQGDARPQNCAHCYSRASHPLCDRAVGQVVAPVGDCAALASMRPFIRIDMDRGIKEARTRMVRPVILVARPSWSAASASATHSSTG